MDKHSAKNDASNEETSSTKPQLSFSIESILRRKGPSQAARDKDKKETQSNSLKQNPCPSSPRNTDLLVRLPWLAYTRYSPPKIPSKF